MRTELLAQVYAGLAQFFSTSRLYELTVEKDGDDHGVGLHVEAFLADDSLQEPGTRELIALSASVSVPLKSLLGQRATLHASLANGSRTRFHGYITHAAMLGSEGGLARYRLRIAPWLWLATQARNSRVWQDKSVSDIVDDVFAAYVPHAVWQWSEDARKLLQEIPLRSYCCQYRETDYDFIRRLLTEEGIAWRFEDDDQKQTMVLFADSTQVCATPEDACSASDGGLRFHAARAGEQQDTIQALRTMRRQLSGTVSIGSYDYKTKRVISRAVPTRIDDLGKHAQLPEVFDYPGQYFYADAAEAERYATIHMQALEARSQQWQARSTVRTLRAGTRFTLTQSPQGDGASFVALRVIGIGVNNLPVAVKQGLAELFGPIPELLETLRQPLPELPDDFHATLTQAADSGYANCFVALDATVPWRPLHPGEDGRQHAKPTARGSQSAIVVGADGGEHPSGADEVYCDGLGRVRIRFHWQEAGDATCWVRVAQRQAGGGMGSQFLPRIGQEVLVQFIENDIDRPIIVGALYNGQGEGGIPVTPGGVVTAHADSPFTPAHDHAPSGQGNTTAGHSPVWHGASADIDGHRNGAAQWGLRSKEFGGSGYNQLLFDDTDQQGRIQLRTTTAGTELNLGHLVHGADNYRGSLRGQGAELRTDAYGAVRAGAGLLVSSYHIQHSALQRDPAGDNAPGIAMLKQAVKLAETFNDAAVKHETVSLAAHAGAGKTKSPLKVMLDGVAGMVDASGTGGKLPHTSTPLFAISARDGLAMTAERDLQVVAGGQAIVFTGQDAQLSSGGQLRLHTAQAIGMLGGVVKPGLQGIGMQMIAARDAMDIQAHAGSLIAQARDVVDVKSSNAHIDFASAKKISLSTAGGANITIDGGNITIQCPGKITIHAGKKSFTGPARVKYPMPSLPRSELKIKKKYAFSS
jgi:Rhs element Vgr protein